MTERARDYAYEALAEVSGTDMEAGRGELNVSLKSIREQTGIEDSYLLAAEIHERAKSYRAVMGEGILLTAPALAKHWQRVALEVERPKGTNLHADATVCSTCKGDRFVPVQTRAVTASVWMKEHGIEPSTGTVEEEWGSCPDCNPQEVSFWRHDGSKFTTPDPARVREMMRK
jgi:hypothetical protein